MAEEIEETVPVPGPDFDEEFSELLCALIGLVRRYPDEKAVVIYNLQHFARQLEEPTEKEKA